MNNKVILIGAGPGDVDLLTLKGKEYIQKADCIIYDRLASKEILQFAKSDCEMIFVGKENHHHVMKQDDINKLLAKKAESNELVVRLKGGDPYVFGRGGEEAIYLKERNVNVEVISGVTSVVSVLASAGIPITHRGMAKGFQVITAHSRKDEPADIDYTQLLDETITLVFLMGLSHVDEIAKGLIKSGRNPNTPAAVISRGTTVFQRKCVGDLTNIAELTEEAGLESPSIIVVGKVVSLSNRLSFFENRPLFGKRILVPYIEGFKFSFSEGVVPFVESPLSTMLREDGAQVTCVKTGQIEPIVIREDLHFPGGSWLVFTSANGVYSFMYNLRIQGLDIRAISSCRLAVVGTKTANILARFGLRADLVAKEQTAAHLGKELGAMVNSETYVYHLVAESVESEVLNQIADKCKAHRIDAYRNIPFEVDINNLHYDAVCFTSASSVTRLLDQVHLNPGCAVVSIGPSCSRKLCSYGITSYLEAKQPSYEGMMQLL